MSSKELMRVGILARIKAGEVKLAHAAEILDVSYRQVKRLWRRYRRQGAGAMKHGNAGRRSSRAKPEKFRRRVLQLVRKKYWGDAETRFGPTLAAEHLAEEDGLKVDAETLRRWMLSEGLWSRERKRKQHRQRRERKKHFGELVQLDGSFHKWLEDRGPCSCLMNMVDDATAKTLCRLEGHETIWAAVGVLRRWIEKYGVPRGLYTDWKNVYKRRPTTREQLHGIAAETQFGRMCERLGIRIIAANSPQAKGRVERNNGTHQDRLVKKLRRKGIASHAAANAYIEGEYLAEHNRRFAQAAAEPTDYHRPSPSRSELDAIFRLETERTISNDWVVRYRGLLLQLKPPSRRYGPTQAKATVCEWEDGRLEVLYRREVIAHALIAYLPARQEEKKPATKKVRAVNRSGPRWNGPGQHPWTQSYEGMKPRSPVRAKARTLLGVPASATP